MRRVVKPFVTAEAHDRMSFGASAASDVIDTKVKQPCGRERNDVAEQTTEATRLFTQEPTSEGKTKG